MRNFKTTDIEEYLPEGATEEYSPNIGDDFRYVPFEETEANFCYLEFIKPVKEDWELVIRVENEFNGEKYTKKYTVNKGSKLELNTFGDLFMCFLPPEKIPVLAEITEVSADSISIKTIGILQEYADDLDKRAAEMAAMERK